MSQDDQELLRSVALQNASTILRARRLAEQQLRAAQEALRDSEQLLRAVFEQAAVGIVIAGLDGKYVVMNRKFCEILGYTEAELREMTFREISHPDDVDRTAALIEDLRAERIDHYAIEKRYLRRDGRAIWGRATVTLLRDAAGVANRFIGVIEDVTSRKEAERALAVTEAERRQLLESERHARAAAERASRMKDEFLATLSHELRTPLSSILGWSQMLRSRPPAADELKRGLETIERNARVQTQLIEDLLDMSRITSGKVRLDVQPLMPSVFVEAALGTVQPSAEAKGIRVEKMLDPDAGPISGDPGRLQQVVWNLLSNAIKFTPRGGRVQVVVQRVDSHVEVRVADTGAGIGAEFIGYVFERFRQADASTTREHGGLGLGLAIVKSLVELHGGTVLASSPGPDLGATFTVCLPLAVAHVPAHGRDRHDPGTAQAPAQDLGMADLSGVKVLVVDDQADSRDLVRRILSDCGAELKDASGGAEALGILERWMPDVLVSDIGMPGMDGFQLLDRIRDLPAGREIAAIALTAFARSEDRTRALRRGFQVHVSKPVEPAELIATVASVTRRRGLREM